MKLARVALPVPLPHAFTYEVPLALAETCTRGARVVCPLGSRRTIGVVLEVYEGEPELRVKPVVSVLEGGSLPEELLVFLRELSAYYFAPIGEVMRLALPPQEREATRATAMAPTLFDKPKGVGGRKVAFAEPTAHVDASAEEKLSASARGLLARLRANGKTPVARLADEWSTARNLLIKLEKLGVVSLGQEEATLDPFFDTPVLRDEEKDPTTAQREAADTIAAALSAGTPSPFLLHGVTGSGKTEVYLRAIREAKRLGKGSIVLVPEIALTPQLVSRFRARFGDGVAVLHSGLSAKDRHRMWHALRSGEVDVAIGARSALFAPAARLGLVVVDEEHDSSFKQEDGVRYHARDMALLRARRAGAVCVLGTATPSLESEHLARTGKIARLVLPERARAQELPRVTVVDLRRVGAGPTGDKRISLPLHRAIEKNLETGGQTILFLNRRGFSPALRCEACNAVASCPNCSVALTFHKAKGAILRCHTCDHEESLRASCHACKSPNVALEGLGTEKLEETLAAAFPTARVARLDRDVAGGKDAEKVLSKMRSHEIDIIVGTQMVTKGHDLPEVTLVGVIAADAALSMPDFRASERAFQLLVQVAGRAGRGDSPGQVIVQTYDPKHPSIHFGVTHDTTGFVTAELLHRRELGYPPYARMVLVRVDAVDPAVALAAASHLADVARAASPPGTVDVLGPAPAPLARVRNRHRFRLMMRSSNRAALRAVALAVARALGSLPHAARAHVDVDPVQML